MEYQLVFYAAMNIIFFSYISIISLKYGVQSSISASYYKLPKNFAWLFTVATWGYAFPAIIVGVEHSSFAFFAGAAITFVGAAPAFRGTSIENSVHMWGAKIGVVASQLMIVFPPFNMWYITVGFLLCSIFCYFNKHIKPYSTWWIEVLAFLSISLSYLLLMIRHGWKF